MQNLKRVAGWFHRMITFAFGSKRMYKNMQHAFSQDCRWKEKNLYLEYLSLWNKRLLIIYTCSCCRLPSRFLSSHGGFLSTRPYRNFYPCWSDKPISKKEPTKGFFNNNPFIELFRFLSCNGLMHLQGIKIEEIRKLQSMSYKLIMSTNADSTINYLITEPLQRRTWNYNGPWS